MNDILDLVLKLTQPTIGTARPSALNEGGLYICFVLVVGAIHMHFLRILFKGFRSLVDDTDAADDWSTPYC